jgi:hypothetical protein
LPKKGVPRGKLRCGFLTPPAGAFSPYSLGGGSVSSPLKHPFHGVSVGNSNIKTAFGGFYNGSDGACPTELSVLLRSSGRQRPLPAPSWRLFLVFTRRGLRFKPPQASLSRSFRR